MPDKNWQFELEEYIRQGEPERAEKQFSYEGLSGEASVKHLANYNGTLILWRKPLFKVPRAKCQSAKLTLWTVL